MSYAMECKAAYTHLTSILFFIFSLIPFPIQAQGLQFYGNESSIEQRTSYHPFGQKNQPVFTDYLDIEFQLKILTANTFGYLLHICNADNPELSYSLTYSYENGNSSAIRFNTEGQMNHISISLHNDSLLSRWIPVRLHLELSTGASQLSIGEHTGKSRLPAAWQKNKFRPQLVFGRREHLVDVPKFAIRDLKIAGKNHRFRFLLNESEGNNVHSSQGTALGTVVNPYWLINDSFHWKKAASFVSPACAGVSFNEQLQQIQIITTDTLIVYHTNSHSTEKRQYAAPLPVEMRLGTNFINGQTGEICVYEINNLPRGSVTMAALNPSTLQWHPIGKAFTRMQLHHHNGYWDSRCNRYLVFGGFGSKQYSNTFLAYNEQQDKWDTLHFEGDRISPRFYSSMTSSPKEQCLYIYGGVGNESGKQEIGHHYYNDLYRVDLAKKRITKCWSKPIDKNQVSSQQMVLSEDQKHLYLIRYAEYIKQTSLQLNRLSIANGTMEPLGDLLPFASGSILSAVSLFFSPRQSEFYCVTQEFDEQAGLVTSSVYTLNAPPVTQKEIDCYAEKHRNRQLRTGLLSGLLALLLVSAIIAWRKLRKKKRQNAPANPSHNEDATGTGQPQTSPATMPGTPAPVSQRSNRIYVYGAFTVYDKLGQDITYLFSRKLKQLFLYILLNSASQGKGVRSSSLNSIFWPDKSEEKVKNSKGVTISNLRKILNNVAGIELVYDKGLFRIEIDRNGCYCDYFMLFDCLQAGCKLPENELLSIWERGKLLENEESPLFDKYKQASEDIIFSVLLKKMPGYYENGRYAQVVRICHVVMKRDPLNEQALDFCIHAHKQMGETEHMYNVYAAFTAEYRKCMGEEYARSIDAILKSTPTFS